MSRRTKNVIMSNEAKVLRRFCEKAGFLMRQAGESLGVSSPLLSQIENGRENIPKGEGLQRYLDFFGVGLSTFKKHVKEYQEEQADRDIIETLIRKISLKAMATLRVIVESFIKDNR